MLHAGRGSSHRRRGKDDGGGAFALIGIGLVMIGSIGGFFGSLIRFQLHFFTSLTGEPGA